MVCKINLRKDQYASSREKSQTAKVKIYANEWVQHGMQKLGKKLSGIEFQVWAKASPTDVKQVMLEKFTVDEELTLRQLQMIARNEPWNTNGVITTEYYDEELCEDEVILSIKDLVRQTVIVGPDETVAYGGFPKTTARVNQEEEVYICDLSALQFQRPWNSGRLVMYRKSGNHIGFLDDFLFENVVGEQRKRYREVERDTTGRYVKVEAEVYFDTVAYKKFVAEDVILCGVALDRRANRWRDKVHFKFLKYGTGHFAGSLGWLLEKHILRGVVDGFEKLFKDHAPKSIKSLEFPFYEKDDESIARLDKLSDEFDIEYSFSQDDALKMTSPKIKRVIATTNCANPHAPIGNAIGSSIDGAICINLRTRGNIFCPALNTRMGGMFLDLSQAENEDD
jgi:hypothetical protein